MLIFYAFDIHDMPAGSLPFDVRPCLATPDHITTSLPTRQHVQPDENIC